MNIISLGKHADNLPVPERIALEEHNLRTYVIEKIIPLFQTANKYVLGIIVILIVADWVILAYVEGAKPSDRLINSHVIMALLGATTVQVGSIILIISTYLFPNRGETQAE